MNTKIIKRDGSSEAFMPEKIMRVLLAAGLEEHLAPKVVTNISNWVKSSEKKEITTIQIRDQLIKELDKVDPYISGLFTWYQKSKDKIHH